MTYSSYTIFFLIILIGRLNAFPKCLVYGFQPVTCKAETTLSNSVSRCTGSLNRQHYNVRRTSKSNPLTLGVNGDVFTRPINVLSKIKALSSFKDKCSIYFQRYGKIFANTNAITSPELAEKDLFPLDQKPNLLTLNISPKLKKRWATGLSLGAMGTLWIASGNGLFMLGFLFMSQICMREYFSMVKAVGVMPAEKTALLSSFICYVTASMFPAYHELVMPLSGTMLVLWLLLFNKKLASISEISTSLLGMFYIGYLPSFWVRLRALNQATFAVPLYLSSWNPWLPEAINQGSIITWWTWLSIVVADCTAYFVGKKYGKHKLSTISSAAGSASPNKTIEGSIGGFIGCILSSMLGGYLMKWPLWIVTGFVYGLALSFIALVGDLTASMMKRDARMKDTGNILPGHGGVLDRFDSYMFTAPVAFFFYHDILPFIQKLVKT